MQRKSLALLYLLALDGPLHRKRVADLLWGHRQALRNLRVELHALNRVLEACGLAGFAAGQDPLSLPRGIELRRSSKHAVDEPLEGLDDLSRAFQGWLDVQRSRLEPSRSGNLPFDELVEDLASELRAPAVVIVEGLPASGRRSFVQALAARLELPIREEARFGNGGVGLHHVQCETACDAGLVQRIAADRRGVWVIERSAFGEDPRLVLELRETLSADRIRYVKLPALDWHAARTTLLADLPHDEAARLQMVTDGLPEYLQEMLHLRPDDGFRAELPFPHKVGAAYQLEARRLPVDARFALERLSVQPGVLFEELIDALGASHHLHELERRHWLRYEDGWRWNFEVARRVIYWTLPLGQRRSYHRLAASCLRTSGRHEASRFHTWMQDSGDDPMPDPVFRSLDPLDPSMSALVHPPAQWTPIEPDLFTSRAAWADDAIWWSQPMCPASRATVRLDVPGEKTLLRLKGRIRWEAPLTCDGAPAGLRVTGVSCVGRGVVLSPSVDVPSLRNGGVVHPADGRFELWLLAPADGTLEISANGAGFVSSFSIDAAVERRLLGETAEAREAYELVRTVPKRSRRTSTHAGTWAWPE